MTYKSEKQRLNDLYENYSKLKKEFEDYKMNSVLWSVEDFEGRAKDRAEWDDTVYDPTKFEGALQLMIKNHDATLGISWETVDFWLDEYCEKHEGNVFSISGYWKSDKTKFEDYLVSEFDGVPKGYNDDQIFFHGLSEQDIQEDLIEYFINTDNQTLVEVIDMFVYQKSSKNERARKLLEQFIKENGLIEAYLNYVSDSKDDGPKYFPRASRSQTSMVENVKMCFLSLSHNRFRNSM